MPTPFTNAPDALLRLWNKFALRGGVDAQNLPDSVQDAYNQVLVLQLKDVRDAVETMNADIRRLEAETLAAAGPPPPLDLLAGSLTLAITCGDEAKHSRRQVHGIVGPFELEIECEIPAHP